MRVKRGIKARRRRKKVMELAEGFRGRAGNTFKQATQKVDKSLVYEYRDRKDRKRMFRRLWVMRINAAARLNGLSYSKLIRGIKAAGIEIDRKVLADLGAHQPAAFSAVAEAAKKALV